MGIVVVVDFLRCERCRASIAAAGRSIECGPACERAHRLCLTCAPVGCVEDAAPAQLELFGGGVSWAQLEFFG